MDERIFDSYHFFVRACLGIELDTSEVKEVINVEEDPEGRDLVTFQCPICGYTHKSLVWRR